METTSSPPKNWFEALDSREQAQITFAIRYAKYHAAAGVPGHGQFMLIAKLVALIDNAPEISFKLERD